jgi:hypothetical protein
LHTIAWVGERASAGLPCFPAVAYELHLVFLNNFFRFHFGVSLKALVIAGQTLVVAYKSTAAPIPRSGTDLGEGLG